VGRLQPKCYREPHGEQCVASECVDAHRHCSGCVRIDLGGPRSTLLLHFKTRLVWYNSFRILRLHVAFYTRSDNSMFVSCASVALCRATKQTDGQP
jgi:hypothetical protein